MTAASWYASTDEYAPRTGGADDAFGAQKEAGSVNLDTSRHRLTPGTRVGDHLIVRGVLGEGGTAVVYEALHTRLGASVALKVVDIAEEYMEGARARLLREAHVCASLEDPHIPRVYDVGELPDGTPYVVMERVSGRTLESALAKGPLPLDVAVRITDDLLLAVEAIENAGIVHRDIKPPNIILQSGGDGTLRVRLMDFGVSKNVNAGSQPGLMASNPSLTQQGAIVGTPHYMAPEQIVGPTVDSRADLYAVGVVAYEMMGGRTPFEGQTTGEVVAAVLHTRPLPLGKLCDVCDELEAWVDKAMAPQRADRFANARVMREALQAAWVRQNMHVAESGRRSSSKKVGVVGALALLGLAIAVPLPAGYDLHALTRFLRPDPSEPARAAAPTAGTSTPTTAPVATGSVAAGSGEHAEPLATPPAAAPIPGWNANAGDPSAAADDLDPTLPQSERVRDKAEAAGVAVEDAVNNDTAKAAAPLPGAESAVAPGTGAPVEATRPVRRAREARDAATRAAQASNPEALAPREAAPQQGILLDEYLRQLDNKIKAAPPPRDDEPPARERERDREPARVPGQPAPNPFDALPENPYGQ